KTSYQFGEVRPKGFVLALKSVKIVRSLDGPGNPGNMEALKLVMAERYISHKRAVRSRRNGVCNSREPCGGSRVEIETVTGNCYTLRSREVHYARHRRLSRL